MSDERDQAALETKAEQSDGGDAYEDDDEVGSPFDHPAFLPVLLVALSVWFGFDGWFSTTIEAVNFNRYGFFFLIGGAAYFTLVEVTKIPYLTAGIWALYALWLGAFSLLGSDDAWWREDSATMIFNQVGAAVCAVVAIYFAAQESRRLGRAATDGSDD